MPRFFDDYSNTYLTHDSAAGRKQQRRGWKFRENFKLHYTRHLEDWRKGPMGLAAAQQAFTRSNASDTALPPLPEGWIERDDECTKAKYYTHESTGNNQWVRPEFIPPAAMGGPNRFAPPRNPEYNNNRYGQGGNHAYRNDSGYGKGNQSGYGSHPPPGGPPPPPNHMISSGAHAPPPLGNFPPPPPLGSFLPPPGGGPTPVANFVPPPGAGGFPPHLPGGHPPMNGLPPGP